MAVSRVMQREGMIGLKLIILVGTRVSREFRLAASEGYRGDNCGNLYKFSNIIIGASLFSAPP